LDRIVIKKLFKWVDRDAFQSTKIDNEGYRILSFGPRYKLITIIIAITLSGSVLLGWLQYLKYHKNILSLLFMTVIFNFISLFLVAWSFGTKIKYSNEKVVLFEFGKPKIVMRWIEISRINMVSNGLVLYNSGNQNIVINYHRTGVREFVDELKNRVSLLVKDNSHEEFVQIHKVLK